MARRVKTGKQLKMKFPKAKRKVNPKAKRIMDRAQEILRKGGKKNSYQKSV